MKVKRLLDSFKYAATGVVSALKSERNMKIHYIVAILVAALGLLLNLEKLEMIILTLTITVVIVSEMINTAIEQVVNLVTKEYHPIAKKAKDISAGAVLMASINSVIVAYILFFDRIMALLK